MVQLVHGLKQAVPCLPSPSPSLPVCRPGCLSACLPVCLSHRFASCRVAILDEGAKREKSVRLGACFSTHWRDPGGGWAGHSLNEASGCAFTSSGRCFGLPNCLDVWTFCRASTFYTRHTNGTTAGGENSIRYTLYTSLCA